MLGRWVQVRLPLQALTPHLQLTTKSISCTQDRSNNRVHPTIILSIDNVDLNLRVICAKISEFQHHDDVYSPAFLTDTVILQTARWSKIYLKRAASILRDCGKELGVEWDDVNILVLPSSQVKSVPEGPYFLHGQGIFEAWKVYSDDCDAFQTTVIPNRFGPHE